MHRRLELEAGVEGVAVVAERESKLILENLCQLSMLLSPILWGIKYALEVSRDVELPQYSPPGVDTVS